MVQGIGLAILLGSMFFFLFSIVFVGAIIGGMVFWILMIVDVANRKFVKQDEKTAWILVVVLAGIIGAIIYYFMIKRNSKL